MNGPYQAPRRRIPFWRDLLAIAPPIGVYWLAVMGSLGLFSAIVLVVLDENDSDDWFVLGGFALSAITFTALGQLAAVLRVRSPLVFLSSTTLFAGSVGIAAYADEVEQVLGDPGAMLLAFVLMLGSFFLMCGLWSLRVHMGIFALWAPTIFATGSILLLAEEFDRVEAWHAGSKYAIWDIWTVLILGATAIVGMLYLAGKESYRLHHWTTSTRAPDRPTSRQKTGYRNPIAGCGSILLLVMLGVVLTVDAGVVAPYLWRTGPGDRETERVTDRTEESGQQEQSGEGGGEGEEEESEEPDNEGEPIDFEAIVEAAQQVASVLCFLFGFLLLTLFGAAAFGLPGRRLLLLRHLRQPLWPVDSTRTVQLHWRLVEIVLRDYGITRRRGETATAMIARSRDLLPATLDPAPLELCAEATDKVLYGYGLAPDDLDRVRRAADMAFEAVWSMLSESQKLRAMYRFL